MDEAEKITIIEGPPPTFEAVTDAGPLGPASPPPDLSARSHISSERLSAGVTMPGDASLLSEQNGGVLTLTLNRPKANAFDQGLVDALLDALRRAEAEASVRSIILTGAGGGFSAGQDVTALGA